MMSNPVLHKELMLRFRLRQPTPARIGLGLLFVVIVGWFYWIGISTLLNDNGPDGGKTAWTIAISLQFMLICLIAPSLTANAITQEREQQTWEMLLFTRLRPDEIVLGKLIGRLATVGILLLVFLPFTLFSWMRASVASSDSSNYLSPGQVISAYLVMGIASFFFTTLGLYLSWRMQRTLYALIVAYVVVVGFLCIGTTLLTAMLASLLEDGRMFERCPLIWINPVRLIMIPLEPTYPYTGSVVVVGLCGYVGFSLLMLWHMIANFRRYAQE